MTVSRSVVPLIWRLGREATVLEKTAGAENELGNTTHTYPERATDPTVLAFKTYPNRNTEIEGRQGDRARDNPIFLIPRGPEQPDPPDFEDRLLYDGETYELGAFTEYDTHVEIVADVVRE
jgi:hypothetical protein